jgi:hypothetical protein
MIATIHEIAPEEIMAHQDGELSAERDQLVSAHLENCADCRGLARSLSSTSQSLAGWSINAAPKLLSSTYNPASLIDRANSTSATSLWQMRNSRIILVLGSAFAVLLLVLLGTPNRLYLDKASVAQPSRTQFEKKRLKEAGNEPYHQWLSTDQTSPSPDSKSPGSSSQENVTADLGDYVTKLPAASPSALRDEQDLTDMTTLQTPMIARTVELQIVVKKFDETRSAVQSILLRHQGYAASLNVSDTDNTARTLNASLRIPSQELAAALSDLKALGHVANESQAGVEVTAQHADLVARLKNSRETEIRLQDILRNRTGKVSDVLEVEREIARVRGEIEEMESERKTLEHRVDFATVTLSLLEEYKAKVGDSTPGTATRFHNAAVAGFRNVTDSALGLVLWFAEYLPPIIFWLVILLAPLTLFWRLRRRAIAAIISPLG